MAPAWSPEKTTLGIGAAEPTQKRVVRPKTPPLDRPAQKRLAMRAYHARQISPGAQQVVMGLPATWHGYLVGTGESLPALGRAAFALLLQPRGETALAASTEPEKKKK